MPTVERRIGAPRTGRAVLSLAGVVAVFVSTLPGLVLLSGLLTVLALTAVLATPALLSLVLTAATTPELVVPLPSASFL